MVTCSSAGRFANQAGKVVGATPTHPKGCPKCWAACRQLHHRRFDSCPRHLDALGKRRAFGVRQHDRVCGDGDTATPRHPVRPLL